MRALAIILVAAACTPEVVSGSYLCGPNSTCPEALVCNGPDNICVHPGVAAPFECAPEPDTEPDDEPGDARMVTLSCDGAGMQIENCLFEEDGGDWVSFVAPTACGERGVEVRVTFPVAFERLGIELWDLDASERIAQDTACPIAPVEGVDLRCVQANVVAGKRYGVQVFPTGVDDCDGRCSFNRYALGMQLTLPR